MIGICWFRNPDRKFWNHFRKLRIRTSLKSREVDTYSSFFFFQIDAELHGENKTQAVDILHKFDTNESNYLPVYTQKFLIHEKVTWVNIVDEECKAAFDLEALV